MENCAEILDVVIENPLGSTVRTLFKPGKGWVVTGRTFSVPLPFEYGYMPGTVNPADEEPVDVIVVGWGPTFPGCRYRVRAVGILLRADGDHKVLAVPHTPAYLSPLQDLVEVDPTTLERVEAWFRPDFVLLGWRDALWAEEWIGACRVACDLAEGGVNHREQVTED